MFYSEFHGPIKCMVYLIMTEKMLVSQMCFININELTGPFLFFYSSQEYSIKGRRRKNGLGSRQIVKAQTSVFCGTIEVCLTLSKGIYLLIFK